MDKPNIAVKDIESALKFRRAIKSFDPKKKISDEEIELILEAIRLAPTSRTGLSRLMLSWRKTPISVKGLKKLPALTLRNLLPAIC